VRIWFCIIKKVLYYEKSRESEKEKYIKIWIVLEKRREREYMRIYVREKEDNENPL